MKGERTVAGVACSEVLADLSEFVDGLLPPARAEQLQAHVADCDVCERFGADFASAVGALRKIGEAPALDEGVADRLKQALDEL